MAESAELPDRPIYHVPGKLAYVRALFRHATDEWKEFLQHDRRVIGISAATIVIGILFSALSIGWRATKDVLPGMLIALLPTLVLAIGVYSWCLAKAPYKLYKRQMERATGTEEAGSDPERFRDELFALAAQIERFADERHADDPALADVPIELQFQENMRTVYDLQYRREKERAVRHHHSRTMDLYDERFATRVLAIRRALRARGHSDQRLEDYPTNLGEVRAAARALADAADKTQTISVARSSDFTDLMATQLRLTNENAALRAELALRPRPRELSEEQSKRIADVLNQWPVDLDHVHKRKVLVTASVMAPDAASYAGQILMAVERGNIWAEYPVQEFNWHDERSMALHSANVTVCGVDQRKEGQKLEKVLYDAFLAAGVRVDLREDFVSFGRVAVVVGSGRGSLASAQ